LRQARHIGSRSIRLEAEIVRRHEEQTNVVMVMTAGMGSGMRSFHPEVPTKRGQGAFAGIFAVRSKWAFHFGNVAYFPDAAPDFCYHRVLANAVIDTIDSPAEKQKMTPPRLKSDFSFTVLACLLLAGAFGQSTAVAQAPPVDPAQVAETKAHYTKYEYHIPMRDGVKLFTAVYVPKDHSQKYPIFLNRTPYSVRPYGADQYRPRLGPSPLYDKAGYIFAFQDVRGCHMSEGKFVNVRPYIPNKKGKEIDETSDTYDTIDWLVKNVENNNGNVGISGISYPGFYTACGMIDAHPALKAASPQAPVTDWFVGDDFHHNGAFYLGDSISFLTFFDKPHPRPTSGNSGRPERKSEPEVYSYYLKLGPLNTTNKRIMHGDAAFLQEMTEHGSYDDYWKARNILPHLKNIKPAVLTVGGWFDAEDLFGPLQVYSHVEKNSPGATNRLVMGPWIHGGWARGDGDKLGDIPFNAKTSDHFREKIEFPFFEYYLKGKGKLDKTEAWMFETGSNVWRGYDAWPPKGVKPKSLYFQEGGKLAENPPAASKKKSDKDSDEYVSDPAHPVPFIERTVNTIARDYMDADQRFATRRSDVVAYVGPVLEEDVTIAGPITADLTVSTSGTDSDWVVKLIDVYPDDYPDPNPNPTNVHMGNYQQLVRAEIMRGKFRDSYEKPEPFVPNKPTKVKFKLNDALHNFRSGHRIMVQVQSSWFPLIDRNPQVFTDIYSAKESDYRKATQHVYHSPEHPSSISVLVVPPVGQTR
jgi:putative CocE/NonD family hydrolase